MMKQKSGYFKGRCTEYPELPTCDSEEKADEIVREARLQGRNKLAVYQCAFCAGFHLVLKSNLENLKFREKLPRDTSASWELIPLQKSEQKYKGPCLGTPDKKAYDTLEQAVLAAKFVDQKWSTKVNPYRCQFCDKFHLTSH